MEEAMDGNARKRPRKRHGWPVDPTLPARQLARQRCHQRHTHEARPRKSEASLRAGQLRATTRWRTAAEMGGALMVELQQLELLKQEHARLEEAKEESDQAREELEWRVEELETSQQQLQALLKERDAEQGGAPKRGPRCHSALPSAAIRRDTP